MVAYKEYMGKEGLVAHETGYAGSKGGHRERSGHLGR
jgi:hypothetical protein